MPFMRQVRCADPGGQTAKALATAADIGSKPATRTGALVYLVTAPLLMSPLAFKDPEAIVVGKPMPFSVYDSDRKLLLAKGLPVTSGRMRDVLLAQATYVPSPENDTGAAELPAPASASGWDSLAGDAKKGAATPAFSGTLADLCRSYANYDERSRFGMRIGRDERAESYPAFVLGVVNEKRCLILSAPVNKENVLLPIVKDEIWLCRLFNATTVFRFLGRILKVAYEPIPYIHVELPKSIERRMVRKQPRALASLAATLHDAGGEPAIIVDISVSGVRLAMKKDMPLQKNTVVPLLISITMLGRPYHLTINTKITATFGAADPKFPDVHFYGARFEFLNEIAALVLHGYVQEQLATELDRLSRVLAIEAVYEASAETWLANKK
jgi:hypothetical protein